MDYDNSAIYDTSFTWDYSGEPHDYGHADHYEDNEAVLYAPADDLEGTPSEFSNGHISDAPTEPSSDADSLYAPDDGLEGTPSELSTGHISDAPTEPSTDADSLYEPEDDSEGTPSELSTGHISNAPTEPSSDEEPLSSTEDDTEGTPSESSISHDTDASTKRPPHEGRHAASACHTSALSGLATRTTKSHDTKPKSSANGSHHLSAVRSSFAAYAAANSKSSHPAGTPVRSVRFLLPPSTEQEGTPSDSELRPLASPTPHPAEDASANKYEQQLTRFFTQLAKLKRDEAVIHVAADDSSSQLEKLRQLAEIFYIEHVDVHELIVDAQAAEYAWLKHLQALDHSGHAASTVARRRYDHFRQEYGVYANIQRAKELRDMLAEAADQAEQHESRLKALPRHQKNAAFTIYAKMLPVKLYRPPGPPGGSTLPGCQSDKDGHGTPCHPKSNPTPHSGSVLTATPTPGSDSVSTRRSDRQQVTAPDFSELAQNQPAVPSHTRPHCVYCNCHDHWSAACSAYDEQSRKAFWRDRYALPNEQCDTKGHGTPCTMSHRPSPDSGIDAARRESQLSAAPKPLRTGQPAARAEPRPYCVFCRCHDHWSSECPTNDLHARWAFVNEAKLCQQCLRAEHRTADCEHANRRCKHCSARHNAALCPKAFGPAFQPATHQSDLVAGHSSVATAAGDRSPPCQTATPSDPHRHHRDDRFTTTKPLDTKPRSSQSAQPSEVPPAATAVEPHTSHHLADAIASFFQRNSAGSDVVVGFYGRTQDNAGRTFYRILKPLAPPFQHSPVNDLNDHLQVDHVIMLQTTAHVLPRDSLLSSSAFQDAGSLHSTRRSIPAAMSSSHSVTPTAQGVVATVLSDVAPRHVATVVPELATAMRTSPLPRHDALSPTTTDSAQTEVEPETSCTTSRHPRRQRRPRRKKCSRPRSTSHTQSTVLMTTESPAALIATASSQDPPHLSLAISEASGTPLVPTERGDNPSVQPSTPPITTPPTSDRQLPLKRIRTWIASSQKKPLPELSPSATTITTPPSTEAHQSHARTVRTMAPGSHASGNCHEQLLGYAKAYARSSHSEPTTPIIVLFDSSVNHTSCSAMLARNLRLPLSSSATDTGGSPSTLPFITSQLTVLLDGTTGAGVTIPVTLATMSVRSVPTVLVPEGNLLKLQNVSPHATPIRILPHIVIGRDSQHLFRAIVSDNTSKTRSRASDTASATRPTVQPLPGLDGTPSKTEVGRTAASSAATAAHPQSGLRGTPLKTDAGRAADAEWQTPSARKAETSPPPVRSSFAPGGPSTLNERSTGNLQQSFGTPKEACSPIGIDSSSPHTSNKSLLQMKSAKDKHLNQRHESAASTPLNVTRVTTELRADPEDNQLAIDMQPSTDADQNAWSPLRVLPSITPIAQDAGTWDATATSSQQSAAAVAAAADGTAPATPDPAAHAAMAAPAPKLLYEPWSTHDGRSIHETRPRVYTVQVRSHQQWTTPQEACKLKKSELRRTEFDEHRIPQHRQIVLIDTWADNFLTDLRPDVHVRRLPGLATEAVDLARNYYLCHADERRRDELLHGPGHFIDHLRPLSHHFAHEFPYHASYRDGIQNVLRAQKGSFADATLVWFPLDTQLSDFYETARRENRQKAWATALQNPDGTPSGGGIQLRKAFWEKRNDVTLWHSDDYDHDKDREQQTAILETIEDLEQQLQQTNLPNDGQLPIAEDDPSAMDHEPSQQDAPDAEGTPPVADTPLAAHSEPLRTRHSNDESSEVEIIEREESPGVLSDFFNSPAPGPTADVLPIFQHLVNIQTIQPNMQPLINQQTLAVLYPHAGQELLTKMWIDYQKLKLYFSAEQQPAAEAAGTATAVPQSKPSEASLEASTPEDTDLRFFGHDAKTREEHLQLLYQQESRPQPDSSSPQYEDLSEGNDPLADDLNFPIEDVEDLHIDESILDEEEGATAPRAEGNSPQPMDEQGVSTTEARNSETPSTADETTGGTAVRSISSQQPNNDAGNDSSTEVNPIIGHPSVATAAGGRRPSGQPIDNTRDLGQGHSTGATASEDRSPPCTSDTIRTRNTSTEQRRGKTRASSRRPSAPHADIPPWFGEARRGQDW